MAGMSVLAASTIACIALGVAVFAACRASDARGAVDSANRDLCARMVQLVDMLEKTDEDLSKEIKALRSRCP